VQGLQVIPQRQLESLVERFQVGTLVCGVAGTVWVRSLSASKVFDNMWASKVLAEDEAMRSATGGANYKLEHVYLVQLLPLKHHSTNLNIHFMCR
jgi:hypothetical protein